MYILVCFVRTSALSLRHTRDKLSYATSLRREAFCSEPSSEREGDRISGGKSLRLYRSAPLSPLATLTHKPKASPPFREGEAVFQFVGKLKD